VGHHVRRSRRRHDSTTTSPLVVLPTDRPTAYAVPGRPGHIVVSAGMLRVLDAGERRVLLAHERSHLRRGHHRYLWVAGISAAVFPVLRPLRTRVRFAVERWADEDAASEVGDRRLVARTIFRASLAESGPAPALGLAGLGVRARVEALLDRPDTASALHGVALASGLAALGVGVAGSTVQFHHLLIFAGHVCPT